MVGRQVLLTGALGFAAYLALGSPIALVGGLFIGWSLGCSDLRTKAETARLRIAQELPEYVQLMAAESASGAALETVPNLPEGIGFIPFDVPSPLKPHMILSLQHFGFCYR
jgi:Flp pilus assembly protein TadB